MNILALDVATKTGWATATASGVWDLRPKRDESQGMRLIRFKAKLTEIIRLEQIDIVVFERSAGRHQNAVIVQSELHGVLKTVCEEMQVEYKAYSASEIKRFATGKGNANKSAMVAKAKEVFSHLTIIDDNHADVLFLYNLAMEDIGYN